MPVRPVASRPARVEKAATYAVMLAAGCIWPECEQPSWADLHLPLCQPRAAKVYVAVADVVPKEART